MGCVMLQLPETESLTRFTFSVPLTISIALTALVSCQMKLFAVGVGEPVGADAFLAVRKKARPIRMSRAAAMISVVL